MWSKHFKWKIITNGFNTHDNFPPQMCYLFTHFLHTQGLFLWEKYFSSMGQIIITALDIINDRIFPHHAKTYEVCYTLAEFKIMGGYHAKVTFGMPSQF